MEFKLCIFCYIAIYMYASVYVDRECVVSSSSDDDELEMTSLDAQQAQQQVPTMYKSPQMLMTSSASVKSASAIGRRIADEVLR